METFKNLFKETTKDFNPFTKFIVLTVVAIILCSAALLAVNIISGNVPTQILY